MVLQVTQYFTATTAKSKWHQCTGILVKFSARLSYILELQQSFQDTHTLHSFSAVAVTNRYVEGWPATAL